MDENCGNCKHWKRNRGSKYKNFGTCAGVEEGREWTEDGRTYRFSPFIFGDEVYNDVFSCFVPKEGDHD